MRAKVVLYNPRSVFYTMPLALVAVGSALDAERYEVRIVDARLEREPLAALEREIRGALLLGVTVLTGDPIRDALAASRHAKALRPELPVVWGGWHPSLFASETLDEPSIDFTVQAQGEATFRELVDGIAAGASADDVRGITHRQGRAVRRNPPRAMVPMDDLPAYDYDLLPVERYFDLKRRRQFDYVSSIGCYFRCAFCADPFVFNRRWSALSPRRMGEEIESHWLRYRFTEVAFQDETFFTYRDRVAEIAEQFLARGLRFDWTATLRADQGTRLEADTFALCVRSGLRRVMVGVESGSQEMLDWMSKDATVAQVLETAEMCVHHQVGAIFPFIVGFPGESDESVQATVQLVKRLRAMSPRFETPIFYFKPYPGSRITAEMQARGYRLPASLEEWADFDFIGSSGPWVSPAKARLIERFKFYNRFAWGPETWARWPLQKISRWRCNRDWYGIPLERALIEWLHPEPRLS